MLRATHARPQRVGAPFPPPALPATSRSATVKADLASAPRPATAAPIRVLIADDHAVLREGLRALLTSQRDVTVVGEAANGEDVLPMVDDLGADILLLDYSMPGMSGLDVMQQLRARE